MQGFTPLQRAALRDEASIVKFLLKSGASAVTRSWYNACVTACVLVVPTCAYTWYILCPALTHERASLQAHAIHTLHMLAQPDDSIQLQAAANKVFAMVLQGQTALHLACSKTVVDQLLQYGARIDAEDAQVSCLYTGCRVSLHIHKPTGQPVLICMLCMRV